MPAVYQHRDENSRIFAKSRTKKSLDEVNRGRSSSRDGGKINRTDQNKNFDRITG
jgi:hypothetical protein